MVVVVLGFDGLEYDLVERYKLDSIKQKNYTKTNIGDFRDSFTPVLWASMLTGEKRKEMESILIPEKKEGEVERVAGIFQEATLGIRQKIGRWLESHGITAPWIPHLRVQTWLRDRGIKSILEETNSWYLSIPGHSGFPKWHKKRGDLLRKYLDGKEAAGEKLKELVWKGYRERKRRLLQALENKENYDLIFFYTYILDALGHHFQTDKICIMKSYMDVHSFVKNVRGKLDNNVILFIISDHGMKEISGSGGDHSDHGFFSSNSGDLIEKPQDLYALLKKRCSVD